MKVAGFLKPEAGNDPASASDASGVCGVLPGFLEIAFALGF
jgi:hypothetical protein